MDEFDQHNNNNNSNKKKKCKCLDLATATITTITTLLSNVFNNNRPTEAMTDSLTDHAALK